MTETDHHKTAANGLDRRAHPLDLHVFDANRRALSGRRVTEQARLQEAFGQLNPTDKDEEVLLLHAFLSTLAANTEHLDGRFSISGTLAVVDPNGKLGETDTSPRTTPSVVQDWITIAAQTIVGLNMPARIRWLALEYTANLVRAENQTARDRLWQTAGARRPRALTRTELETLEQRPSVIGLFVARLARDTRLLCLTSDVQAAIEHFRHARAAAKTLVGHFCLNVLDHRLLKTIAAATHDLLGLVTQAEKTVLACIRRRQEVAVQDKRDLNVEDALRGLINRQLGLESIEPWDEWWVRADRLLHPETCVRVGLAELKRRVTRETEKLRGRFSAEPSAARQRSSRRLVQHIEGLNQDLLPTDARIAADEENCFVLLDVLETRAPALAIPEKLGKVHNLVEDRTLCHELATHRVARLEEEKPQLRRAAHAELTIWEELYRHTRPTEYQSAHLRRLVRELASYLHERGCDARVDASHCDPGRPDVFALARTAADTLESTAEFETFHRWLAQVRAVYENPTCPAQPAGGDPSPTPIPTHTIATHGAVYTTPPSSSETPFRHPGHPASREPAPTPEAKSENPRAATDTPPRKRTTSWRGWPWNWGRAKKPSRNPKRDLNQKTS
jgi:hypothetical protein